MKTDTEGTIKYRLDYAPSTLPADVDVAGLLHWFGVCRARHLIGRDPARYGGCAYGNISVRATPGFVISGTQTGGDTELRRDRLSWVKDFDIRVNRLTAGGPAPPSSEAMTHGQVYRARPGVGAVIHIHSTTLWHAASTLRLPVTSPDVGYGTPSMATEVERLLRNSSGDVGAFSMGGHEDGIVAYGSDIGEAGSLTLELMRRAS